MTWTEMETALITIVDDVDDTPCKINPSITRDQYWNILWDAFTSSHEKYVPLKICEDFKREFGGLL